jgi:hypothetical protein
MVNLTSDESSDYVREGQAEALRASVLPAQLACGQVQSTSGVSSIASHSTLQYSPSVTWQLQTGCAHFLGAISFSSSIELLPNY